MKQKKQSEKVDSSADTEVIPDPLLQRLEALIAIAEKSDLATVRIRDGEVEIEISRTTAQSVVSSALANPNTAAPTLVTENEAGDDIIRSPMPARFYRSPAPDEPPFIEIGDTVTAGASLATLEVMKTFNDVEAPFNCEILEILVEDGEAVEYNQPLFRVRQT
ncbi:MAG: acetyl-CoA carboxylase, biotin carboxyl carrier protein [Candidatus Poribacteria bacterium]|nr:acetyl-CoA carboxylase, biotin carboxyl carrier protein [Candidatus Poribacteria bacterium]